MAGSQLPPDLPADGAKHLPVRLPVVAVHLADILAVSDLLGEGPRVVAHVGRAGISRPDQPAIIHEGTPVRRVDAKPQRPPGQLHRGSVPPGVRPSVGRDPEPVVMLPAKLALPPSRLDSRLRQHHHRVDPESLPGRLGQGGVRLDKTHDNHQFSITQISSGRSDSGPSSNRDGSAKASSFS